MSESIASSSRGGPSSKRPRRAASPYNSDAPGSKRDRSNSKTENSRKPRAVLSCAECNRRKQKCDRQEPCSQCVARGVPHLCTPVTETDEDTSLLHQLDKRMSFMEKQISQILALVSSSSSERTTETTMAEPGSSTPRPSGWNAKAYRAIHLDPATNPGLQSVLPLVQKSGVSKAQLEAVLAGIPGKRLSDDLVNLYFEHINWTRYPIHQPYFRKRYNSLYQSLARRPLNPDIDLRLLRWLPVLFSVLVIATHEIPEDILPSEDQLLWEERLYASARTAGDCARATAMENVDVILGAILISRYTLMIRRAAEGGIPMSIAFPLGLYRDGTILGLPSPKDVEIRRRAWAMLYHLDRSIGLLVGRPPVISDAHTDTRPPANLDDAELEGDFDPAGHHLSHPTSWTYIVVRHHLAEILGRIAFHTFTVHPPVYQTVLDLDRDLLAWQAGLPAFLAMSNPDRTHDADHSYLYVQRHLLALEWYYARVTLHRPYLLRRGANESQYVYSQTAAIESAKNDLLARREFVMEKGSMTSSGGYRLLDSMMVLEVVMKLEPDTPRTAELRRVIELVSGRQSDELGRVSEPLGQEELSTIAGLTARTATQPLPKRVDHPEDASMRDVQAQSLVDFVKKAHPAAQVTNGSTSTSATAWPLTTSPPESALPNSLAGWATVLGQQTTSVPPVPAPAEPEALNSSTSLLDSLLGNVNRQGTFDVSFDDFNYPGETHEQRFNPFALAQSYPITDTSASSAVDEQTQLFDYLLSAIANQQPVGQ